MSESEGGQQAMTTVRIRIAFEGFELNMTGPEDAVSDVLAVLTDRIVVAFRKAKEAARPKEDKAI